jgi:hypothetical protein
LRSAEFAGGMTSLLAWNIALARFVWFFPVGEERL